MRVRVVGPSLSDGRGRRFHTGQVVEVPDRVGAAWIAHLLAVRVLDDTAAASAAPAVLGADATDKDLAGLDAKALGQWVTAHPGEHARVRALEEARSRPRARVLKVLDDLAANPATTEEGNDAGTGTEPGDEPTDPAGDAPATGEGDQAPTLDASDAGIEPLGGGWFLVKGQRIRGLDEARKALTEP